MGRVEISPGVAVQAALAVLRRLQPRGLGEIEAKPVALPLVTTGHFGAGVAKVFLHKRFAAPLLEEDKRGEDRRTRG